MFHSAFRRFLPLVLATITVITVFQILRQHSRQYTLDGDFRLSPPNQFQPNFKWRNVAQRYPVDAYTALPTGPLESIPRIQADFGTEPEEQRVTREARLNAVKEAFVHSWEGYKSHAWMHDEVSPLSGGSNNAFGGWGATLIDSLDTLWIMGLEGEFNAAVSGLENVDFSSTSLDTMNLFETNIRFLGGLLGAYDVSGRSYDLLLQKATQLGDMLYAAFDTPDRMPVTRWDWKNAAAGGEQDAESHALLAEVGSLSLEFTRLSQLTGNNKWYDATARVMSSLHEGQNRTRLSGLWPQMLDMINLDFSRDTLFNMGSMSDSLYEYLPKQYLLLGGRQNQYYDMYSTALRSAKEHLFFQPLNQNNSRMLIAGTRSRYSSFKDDLIPEGQHLTCFVGGMVALAAKAFHQPEELDTARQLVDGCLWAYESMPLGIMPESFTAVPCLEDMYDNCTWSQQAWYEAVYSHAHQAALVSESIEESAQHIITHSNLPPGIVDIPDRRYNLRPEAIESVFVLYRISGDKTLQDRAWNMFQTINNVTRTEIAYASVEDVTREQPVLSDSMESFWTAETLKYFYLIFSEPDVISLDEYVFNTEAHPLLRPT